MVRIIIFHLFLDSKVSKKEIEKETLAFDLQNAEFLVLLTMNTAYPCLQRKVLCRQGWMVLFCRISLTYKHKEDGLGSIPFVSTPFEKNGILPNLLDGYISLLSESEGYKHSRTIRLISQSFSSPLRE